MERNLNSVFVCVLFKRKRVYSLVEVVLSSQKIKKKDR